MRWDKDIDDKEIEKVAYVLDVVLLGAILSALQSWVSCRVVGEFVQHLRHFCKGVGAKKALKSKRMVDCRLNLVALDIAAHS